MINFLLLVLIIFCKPNILYAGKNPHIPERDKLPDPSGDEECSFHAFLKSQLCQDADKRKTALELLKHDFLATGRHQEEDTINKLLNRLSNLQALHGENATRADIAKCLEDIGNAHAANEEWQESLEFRQRSLKILKKLYGVVPKAETERVLQDVGVSLHHLNKFTQSLEHFQEAFKMGQKLHYSGSTSAVAQLEQLGDTFEKLGRHEEALEYKKKAFQLEEKIYGSDVTHISIAQSLENIGMLLDKLGRYEEALEVKRKALEMRKKIHDDA